MSLTDVELYKLGGFSGDEALGFGADLDDDDTQLELLELFWIGEAVTPPPVDAPAVDYVPVSLIDLAGIGQRFSHVRFDLLDQTGQSIKGTLTPDADQSPPSVEVNTDAALKRIMRGLWLTPDQAADVDPVTDRVRPVWVFTDGTEWPLGTFIFTDTSTMRRSSGTPLTASLVDHSLILNQSGDVAVSYPPGSVVSTLLDSEWAQSGIASWTVEPSGTILGAPLTWAPDTTRLRRMADLSRLGGYLDPYVDNNGIGRSRIVPDPATEATVLAYDDNPVYGRVFADSPVESDDLLTAPNSFLVVSTSGSSAPVTASADVPADAPHSYARRGIRVTKTIRVQGIATVADAQVIANAEANRSGLTFSYAEFDSAPDPRHDVYDIVRYFGANYLELGWRLTLREGSDHHHRIRKTYDGA